MNMSAEQQAELRWYAIRDATLYITGKMTKDQLKKAIKGAFKYKSWPYLEELEEQGIGSIIWRWKNE